MARRTRHEEHARHEAWAIPYGDLVTLLMAFFVVMYAVSVVDAGKYRILSDSLVEAFGTPRVVDPIQIGDPSLPIYRLGDDVFRSLMPIQVNSISSLSDAQISTPTEVALDAVLESASQIERQQMADQIHALDQTFERELRDSISAGDVYVDEKSHWLEISIDTNLLFTSGSAVIEAVARPMLVKIAAILAGREARIHVEGHTDDLPISNSVYPSNWELSSGRAATVVNLFAQNGVDPQRMVAIGYAEFQPIADNESVQGRARNRRVQVIVLPGVSWHSRDMVGPEELRYE